MEGAAEKMDSAMYAVEFCENPMEFRKN